MMTLKDFKRQRFQILQTFHVQHILGGYSFIPKEFLEKWVLRLQQLMQTFFNHYQASPKPKRFKCSTPAFKYHSSTIALKTLQAS